MSYNVRATYNIRTRYLPETPLVQASRECTNNRDGFDDLQLKEG